MSTQQPGLRNSYLLYKRPTRQVARWLTETASRSTDLHTYVRFLRDKKNQRLVKRGADIELHADEYVSLANVVASNSAKIISACIIRIITQAIEGRKIVASQYVGDSLRHHGRLSEVDRTHQHFIDVLQEVRELLEDARSKARLSTAVHSNEGPELSRGSLAGHHPPNPQDEDDEEVAADSLSADNFDGLSPDKWFEAANSPKRPRDALGLELRCHLEDFNDVRQSLQETWQEYNNGTISFLAASITTEIAFGLLRSADAQFTVDHSDLDGYWKILEFFGLQVIKSEHHPVVYIYNTGQRETGEVLDDISNFVCGAGVVLAESHNKSLARMSDNVHKRSGKAELQEEINWIRWHPFAQELLPTGWKLLVVKEQAPHHRMDNFIEGVATQPIPTWVVYTYQIYMDIFDILGPNRLAGLALVDATIEQRKHAYETSPESFAITQVNQKGLKNKTKIDPATLAQRPLDLLHEDTAVFDRGDVKNPAYAVQLKAFNDSRNKFVTGLERSLPVHAGGTAFDALTDLLELGCHLANQKSAMTCIAYLYKAARNTNLLARDWPDMELFISSQTSNSPDPFIPKFRWDCRLDQFRVRFESALGFNGKTCVKRGQWQEPNAVLSGKPICVGAQYIARLKELYGKFGQDTANSKSSSVLPKNKIVEILLYHLTIEQKKNIGGSSKQLESEEELQGNKGFTPVKLLSTFKSTFHKDEIFMRFDLVQFWEQCSSLLDDLMKEAAKTLTESYMTGEGTPTHTMLTWNVLRQVEDSTRESVHQTTLKSLADLIEAHISNNRGKTLRQQALEQISGNIARRLKPVPHQKAEAQMMEAFVGHGQAGTSLASTGEVVTLYHPKLTHKHVADMTAHADKKPEEIAFPWYVVLAEPRVQSEGDTARSSPKRPRDGDEDEEHPQLVMKNFRLKL